MTERDDDMSEPRPVAFGAWYDREGRFLGATLDKDDVAYEGLNGISFLPLYSSKALQALREENERLRGLIRWAHETLYEINPSNYDHDDVCKVNDASVEVILGLAPTLGERHGKTEDWWKGLATEAAEARATASEARLEEARKVISGYVERDENEGVTLRSDEDRLRAARRFFTALQDKENTNADQ